MTETFKYKTLGYRGEGKKEGEGRETERGTRIIKSGNIEHIEETKLKHMRMKA